MKNLFYPVCDLCNKTGIRKRMIQKGKRFHHSYYHPTCWQMFIDEENRKIAERDVLFERKIAKLKLLKAGLEYAKINPEKVDPDIKLALQVEALIEIKRIKESPLEDNI